MRGKRIISLVAVLALLSSVLVVPAALAQQTAPTRGAASVPITGSGQNSTFTGTYGIQRFVARNGQLVAIGTLTGTLTNTLTGVTKTVNRALALPITASATCDILHLTLGPLDLNLLGLVVHLDQVVLDITAQSGPGNLLGNLLCAVAGLLDNNGPLGSIAQLLNQILAAL
jgi:hypothetical protein